MMAINPTPGEDGSQPGTTDGNANPEEEEIGRISRLGAIGAGFLSLVGAPLAAFAARSGGRVGGRAPAARAPSRSYSAPSSSRTNVYVTPPTRTNVYVTPGFGGYGYGGYGGYGYGGYGRGSLAVDGAFLGLSLIDSIRREEERRRYIEQQLKTQQELGKDQALIQQLQFQLQEQNSKIDGLRQKAGPEETDAVKSMQQKLEAQQREIEELRKNQK
jgi:hypothetical protein